MDGGSDALRPAADGAGLHDAEPPRRRDAGPVRRRRRRRDAARPARTTFRRSYRIGIGSAGNVAAGAITTLIDRPLGVSGVTNPLPATGGQDAQSVDDIRANAPLSVLTLGRAVSITDYQNFAATFAGIAKA